MTMDIQTIQKQKSTFLTSLYRHLRVLTALLKIRVGRQMMYRASFWTAFFVDTSLFLVQLAVFSVLLLNVDTVGGWNRAQMVFFIGTFSIVDGLEMCFYFFGIIGLPEKIRSGKLDLYLTRPIRPLFLLAFESIDIGSIFLTLPGIIMVSWATAELGIVPTPGRVLGYLFLLLLMLILLFNLMLLLRSMAFWFTRVDAVEELEGELMNFAFRIPGVVFQGAARIVLYTVLPFALLATLPTRFFTEGLFLWEWGAALGVTAMFSLFARLAWRRGLRQYNSTGT